MGSATTSATGAYSIWYDGSKDWDWCCFGATNPDPQVEVGGAAGCRPGVQRRRWEPGTASQPVALSAASCQTSETSLFCLLTATAACLHTLGLQIWVGNVLWLSTSELASDVTSDKTFNFVITPRKISGTVYWAGTSEKVAGATVKASGG